MPALALGIRGRGSRVSPFCYTAPAAKNFILSQIGNADQTPHCFDMPRNTTVEEKGARSVLIRTSGAEKLRCTVMLAVTADGRKLPPYVIFKRKTLPKGNFGGQIHVRVQEKGWMNE